ncbi:MULTISPECIES: hypothetical protein [Acidovorax]|uniref:Uncharacterized protein n=2 Tax=Acidovorax TaxID=12916 RepID=A0ABV8DKH9_9BURK|nr:MULTISPECIES: hypothetical protein [Acidovorax]KQB57323.1 hypothetical protein AE621_21340 [Acidovorax sp. SD340]MCO4241702.1 hypothetical protein [Acidovorax facilis]
MHQSSLQDMFVTHCWKAAAILIPVCALVAGCSAPLPARQEAYRLADMGGAPVYGPRNADRVDDLAIVVWDKPVRYVRTKPGKASVGSAALSTKQIARVAVRHGEADLQGVKTTSLLPKDAERYLVDFVVATETDLEGIDKAWAEQVLPKFLAAGYQRGKFVVAGMKVMATDNPVIEIRAILQ